jgi:hypothetical protein
MTKNQRKLAAYQQANRETAEIIASDPRRYPPGSLLQEWAVRILEQARPAMVNAKPATLFDGENGTTEQIGTCSNLLERQQ